MSKKDIITFEMAKKAKLAGFKKNTKYYYESNGVLQKLHVSLNFNISSEFYSAMTHEEYLKWINTKGNDSRRNRA